MPFETTEVSCESAIYISIDCRSYKLLRWKLFPNIGSVFLQTKCAELN